MLRLFLLVFVCLYLVQLAVLSQQPPGSAASQSPTNQTAANQPPVNTTPASPDPALVTFESPAGLLIVTVRADKVADYESAIVALQDALSKVEDPMRRQQAAGWRVFKSATPDTKTNVVFIHLLEPVVPKADYRPSILLDELLEDAPTDLLAKYRDAIAAGPNKLELTEFARMSVAPVKNAAPATPDAPDKPRNVTPQQPD